ncbi:hypothetical protein AABB02_00050, partial [Streptomyces rimosus]|uniref:hypothetical protein n=1 Tax=Streptomyces rimosus TaxID=1927 RepID=UPI0031D1E0F1
MRSLAEFIRELIVQDTNEDLAARGPAAAPADAPPSAIPGKRHSHEGTGHTANRSQVVVCRWVRSQRLRAARTPRPFPSDHLIVGPGVSLT